MVYEPSAGRDFYDDQYEDDEDQVLNNRIVFPKDKVYGRTKELQLLADIFGQMYDKITKDDGKEAEPPLSPVVFIQASAGTGKSAVVRSFIEQQETRAKDPEKGDLVNYTMICHMQGRFERSGTDPFSAILDALGDYFERLLNSKDSANTRNLARIRVAINDSLDHETSSLTALIPRLGDVLRSGRDRKGIKTPEELLEGISGMSSTSSHSRKSEASDSINIGGANTWNRIRYLFNALFCTICNKEYPLIMFLDDCQWADDESLALIESLLQDPACRYFMFIGNATRGITEAKDKQTKFAKLMQDIEGPSRSVTRITLLNLSIDEIGEFIADTLELGVEECRPLTEVIYGKTRGNIFFSMQALEELKRRNILYFSMILFRWEWNLDGVEFQNALSDLSDDVGKFVSSKLQSLPRKLRRALVIASHARANFDIGTLQALMNEDGIDIDFKELNGLLDLAVLVGLLQNTIGTGLYRFANDRVQQSAYWMVASGEERGNLRIMIGRKLYDLYFEPEGKEWMLFAAADHLNTCIGHGGKDNLSLAELNFLCGKKARFLAAFECASMYLRLALSYLRKLEENPWKSHYELSLQIYREIADSELCLGNFENGNKLAHIVFKQTRDLEDKLCTFLALAQAKGRQQQHAESLFLCQDALVRVGAIPKRIHYVHMMKDISVIKRLLKKCSDYEILMLPTLHDKHHLMVMDLLSQAVRSAQFCGNKTEFRFCIARQLRLTFKFGFTRGSAYAFAAYGHLLHDDGKDIESALRMARLAREILVKIESITGGIKCQTLFTLAYWIEAWNCPREHVMKTLQEGHKAGMAKGNIEVGFLCIVVCNTFAQSVGYPLEPIEKAGAELIEQLRLYKVDSVLANLAQSRLSVLCLVGKKKIDWEDLERSENMDIGQSDLYTYVFSLITRLELGILFNNVEFAVKMAERMDCYHDFGRSYLCCSKECFYSAIAYIRLARKTGMAKHRAKAAKYVKTLRYACRTRGLNVLHKCLIMEAEMLSLECRDTQKLTYAYDEAILAAVKIGYTQDAALGSELAGAAMEAMSEDSRADQYLSQACNLWREYGASAKVRQISLHRNLKMDDDSDFSISFGKKVYTSKEMSESRQAFNLDLLVGVSMKNDVHGDVTGRRSHDLPLSS